MPSATNSPHLLIVEDDELLAMHMQLQLNGLGYTKVTIVFDGESALASMAVDRADLILMDIELGEGIDGVTTAQRVRENYDVPVIFVSAHFGELIVERAKQVGPFGYILKPASIRELHATLEMALYKHQAEKKIRALAEHNQAIVNNMFDGVITINAAGAIESFNHAASQMFGYSVAEVLGKNVSILMPEPHRSHHDGYLGHYQQTGEARIIGQPRELEAQHKNGDVFPITLAITKISHAGETVFIGMIRDMSQHRKDENEIRRLAFYDDLTKLPNRRLLFERLQHAMHTSTRSGLHGAVMFIDLDQFKHINDTLGHHIGDQLLVHVASQLKNAVREGDTVARLGGDEFVILLENLARNEHEAARQTEFVAKKILQLLEQPYALDDSIYIGTASIGIMLFLQEREPINDLLKKADVAMYQAKTAGRNTLRFFDPTMQAVANAHLALKQDLQRGIHEGQFALHYQIQVTSDNAITGVEALIRWHHPKHGLVSPAQFIPLAEETGLILELGQWVLEEACRQLVNWAKHTSSARWTIAVNVSASQFGHVDFVDNVLSALATTGANPKLLKLELTESMLVNDIDSIIDKMTAIKARGVSFSLDDFGTGYSSLTYLKRLPLDQLKIDQSFVRDVLNDPSDAMIVHTILALGHNLHLQVIAEGVESEAQRNFLAAIGCDAFQGYYFGRPAAANCLSQFIQTLESKQHASLA